MGILDADVYGPSVPKLMNLKGSPELTESRCPFLLKVKGFLFLTVFTYIEKIPHLIEILTWSSVCGRKILPP